MLSHDLSPATSEETPALEPVPARSPFSRIARVVLLAFPVVVFALEGWAHRWVDEDAFIDLRVVQQVLQGHGPVYNTGQRVEAYTSPLWVALLAVAHAVTRVRLEWLTVFIGIGGSVAGLALVTIGSKHLVTKVSKPGAWLVPTGALVPIALWPMWYFESSGLETGLVFGWLGLSLWILSRWNGQDRVPAWGAVVLGLGWLIRPDLAIFSFVFLGVLVLGQRPRPRLRTSAIVAAEMFALPVLYQLFRMGYFANALPNTALAKESSLARWSVGWQYFTDSFGPYWIWVPAVALILGGYLPLLYAQHRARERTAQLVVLAFLLGAVLHALYIIRVGGDYIAARLLLPAVFAFVAPVSVSPLSRRFVVSLAVVPWALVCALSLRGITYVPADNPHPVTLEDLGWASTTHQREVFNRSGVFYEETKIEATPAHGLHLPAAAFWGIGVRAYSVGPRLEVVDMLGLANVLDSHFELVRRGYPGHEKTEPPAWTAALLTAPGSSLSVTEFPPPDLVVPMVPWPDQAAFVKQVAQARTDLECPKIRDLLGRTTRPLTPGLFLSNIWHAVPDTVLRISPDPAVAHRQFCHPTRP